VQKNRIYFNNLRDIDMAINKTAKNLKVEVKNNYISSAKMIHEESDKVEIIAIKENLTLLSNKKIVIKSNKS
jgi:hypothetical protein